jgi:fucose permease
MRPELAPTRVAPPYRRQPITWAAFAALLSFGVLNAGLGVALPYLRDAEHISYLAGALHQVAFAVGGGLAGVLTARVRRMPGRPWTIRGGLLGAAVAWLAVGYGDTLVVTATAAFVVSLLATAALVRLWAVLSDVHGSRRTVAMAEGEVWVSLGGIISPLLIAVMAGTAVGWRSAFVLAAVLVAGTVLGTAFVPIPRPVPRAATNVADTDRGRRVPPLLVVVFAVVALEFALTFWLASYLADDVGLDRQLAVTMVSGLYLANLVGRVLASALAHRFRAEHLLAAALAVVLLGLPILLVAHNAVTAAVGLAVVGMGIAATFPLTSSLHIATSPYGADAAMGHVLAVASLGQVCGPVLVAALAQAFGLRIGLVSLAGFTVIAAGALRRQIRCRPAQRMAR